jgi:hypothetical protein
MTCVDISPDDIIAETPAARQAPYALGTDEKGDLHALPVEYKIGGLFSA